jgi:hypothetical protein
MCNNPGHFKKDCALNKESDRAKHKTGQKSHSAPSTVDVVSMANVSVDTGVQTSNPVHLALTMNMTDVPFVDEESNVNMVNVVHPLSNSALMVM